MKVREVSKIQDS